MNTTVYEETLTGRPHDTSVQKAISDNENVDAVQRHAQVEVEEVVEDRLKGGALDVQVMIYG